MQESEIKQLLIKYINNTCTAEELTWLLPYIEQKKGRQELEKLLSEEWNTFTPEAPAAGLAEEWQQRFETRTLKQEKQQISRPLAWLKYVAAIIIITGAASWFLSQVKNNVPQTAAMLESYNVKGRRSQIVLQDGTIVYLGADSRLKYPAQLTGKTRELYLEGEAFFEVKHDTKRPFIVHTHQIQTQVLGTSFKINAFKDHDLSVAVATGKVSVGYQDKTSPLKSLAILTPGKRVIYNTLNQNLTVSSIALSAVKGWKNGDLNFTDVRLGQLIEELERWYNIPFLIRDHELYAYRLSININGNAPITSALDAITAATGTKYHIHHHQIILKK